MKQKAVKPSAPAKPTSHEEAEAAARRRFVAQATKAISELELSQQNISPQVLAERAYEKLQYDLPVREGHLIKQPDGAQQTDLSDLLLQPAGRLTTGAECFVWDDQVS